jgi:2-polyprenyl-3-methyl-5-hydroxy-6-metoxy-1,4-benzoquinol methylase
MADQQGETLSFFSGFATQWREKAEGQAAKVNVIAQRNGAVLRVRGDLPQCRNALDLGCGTGELVIDLAQAGVDSTGIDFAPEMIAKCEEKKARHGVANARFRCGSLFDHDAPPESFDLISGLGLIEYISPAELDRLIATATGWLRPGGALVLGSRNRLFNFVSFNDYTAMERSLGTCDTLCAEAVALSQAVDFPAFVQAADGLSRDLPQPTAHPRTGIGVAARYQYTPAELVRRGRSAGLIATTLFPVHYHGLPVGVGAEHPDWHADLAETVYRAAPEDHRLVPFASSFVLDLRKP